MTDMMLNEDYSDLLQSFVEENVRFILVGAYAMAAVRMLRRRQWSGR